MGPPPPPHVGRWKGREHLWNELTQRDTLAAEAHPHRSGSWRVFDLVTQGSIVPVAILTDTDLRDLETAGVSVVYRR